MENQKDDFTLDNYKRCLLLGLKKDYRFITLDDYFNNKFCLNKKYIILRHDIDTQIDIAVEMAKIESEIGISSTYFIRLHSHAYNPLCVKDLRKIQSIKKMGHEIGFHYESDFYFIINRDIKESLLKEVEILNYLLNVKIRTICPHEPTRTGQFFLDDLDFNQAYDKSILNDFKYISDSSCRWRDGSFMENINQDHMHLYVLTHPYWWYNQTPIENY